MKYLRKIWNFPKIDEIFEKEMQYFRKGWKFPKIEKIF
jgi:hypothetical protein